MVGVGGGVPSAAHDIRLGDVVVSQPQSQHGGVIQYDLIKAGPDGLRSRTGMLNAPPPGLGQAVSRLRSNLDVGRSKIQSHLSNFAANPKFQRCAVETDLLFQSDYRHGMESSCTKCLRSHLIPRSSRPTHDVVVHFGLIASGNQVLRDGIERDSISLELGGALCFEMEAAGLVNRFPCLVVRGICDYADSHKNKQWQPFAAASAASCAKELLTYVSSVRPSVQIAEPVNPDAWLNSAVQEAEDLVTVSDHGNSTIAGTPGEDSRSELPYVRLSLTAEQKREFLESLQFERINSRHADIRTAHAKTCRWIVDTDEYLSWLNDKGFPGHRDFFWIKGNPGTGKSTVMKFILAETSKKLPQAVIASFFFHARGEHLERSILGMYQSILFQLLNGLPVLQEVFSWCRPRSDIAESISWDIDTLKSALEHIIKHSHSQSIVIFIDALDECDGDEVHDMVSFFEHLGNVSDSGSKQFRICISSRHYPHVTIEHSIELVLESQDNHSQDIAKYLHSELKAKHNKFMDQIRSEILERASGIFLWVVLVVQILNKELRRGNQHTMKRRLSEIPNGIERLLEDILIRDENDIGQMSTCFQWVLFAQRPLRIEELYYGIRISTETDIDVAWDREEIDLDDMRKFILNASRGLVEETRTKARNTQFIHESVRGFFLRNKGLEKVFPAQDQNLQAQSHEKLKVCCERYITNVHQDGGSYWLDELPKASSSEAATMRQYVSDNYPFLEYAVRNIFYHSEKAQKSGLTQGHFLKEFPFAQWILLNNVLEKAEIRRYTPHASRMYVFAEKNLPGLIDTEFEHVGSVEIKGERWVYPIIAASQLGNEAALQSLLQNLLRKEIEVPLSKLNDMLSRFRKSKIPVVKKTRSLFCCLTECLDDELSQYLLPLANLHFDEDESKVAQMMKSACHEGCIERVEALLAQFPKFFESCRQHKHAYVQHAAVITSNIKILKLLVAYGMDLDVDISQHITVDRWQTRVDFEPFPTSSFDLTFTSLHLTSMIGDTEVVKYLLDHDKHIWDKHLANCLQLGVKFGHINVVRLLISYDQGQSFGYRSDQCSLSRLLILAIRSKQLEIIVLPLQHGASIYWQYSHGKSAVWWCFEQNYSAALEQLLLFDSKSVDRAVYKNDTSPELVLSIVRLHLITAETLKTFAEKANRTDMDCWLRYTQQKFLRLIQALHEIDHEDEFGCSILLYAIKYGNMEAIRQILERDADPNHCSRSRITLLDSDFADPGLSILSAASKLGFTQAVVELLHLGALIDHRDRGGTTALLWASFHGHTTTAKVLLDYSADLQIRDNKSNTALLLAVENGHIETARLLLTRGASIEDRGYKEETALIRASAFRQVDMVPFVLAQGVSINSKNSDGWTALDFAAFDTCKRRRSILRILLAHGAEPGYLASKQLEIARARYLGQIAELATQFGDRETAMLAFWTQEITPEEKTYLSNLALMCQLFPFGDYT